MPESRPYITFNFLVEIQVEGINGLVGEAAFSECDGLELKTEIKTIHEGGNNAGPIHMMGPLSYGQLTLKRGLSNNTHLIDWYEAVVLKPGLRATAGVSVLAADAGAQAPRATFQLTGVIPVSLKFPALNAREGAVAIEEMHLAYESLSRSL